MRSALPHIAKNIALDGASAPLRSRRASCASALNSLAGGSA